MKAYEFLSGKMVQAALWYQFAATRRQQKATRLALMSVVVAIGFAVIIASANWLILRGSANASPAATSSTIQQNSATPAVIEERTQADGPPYTVYTVREGDSIVSIAGTFGIPWQDIVSFNAEGIARNAALYCGSRSTRYKYRNPQYGHFCNFSIAGKLGETVVFASSIKPGDTLRVPIYE